MSQRQCICVVMALLSCDGLCLGLRGQGVGREEASWMVLGLCAFVVIRGGWTNCRPGTLISEPEEERAGKAFGEEDLQGKDHVAWGVDG